jgi:LPS sulfotransferase NodH
MIEGLFMKSPLKQRAEKLQNELNDVMEVLKKEGQSDSERRYKKIMAEAVFLILFRLDFVSTAVLVILGMVLGHILNNVF